MFAGVTLICFLFPAVRKHTKQDSAMNEEWKSMFGSQEPPLSQTATVGATTATMTTQERRNGAAD